MATLKEKILELLVIDNGLTDREITNIIFGGAHPQQPVNQACNGMNKSGQIIRRIREDGKIGNFVVSETNAIKRDFLKPKNNVCKDPEHSLNIQDINDDTISLGELAFNRTRLSFQYFNKNNVFGELKNKTVLQTLDNERYSKYKDIILEKYHNHINSPIGEFLLFLKNNNDNFYHKFLNYYGDEKYCKFFISDKDVLNKKGLYIYRLGNEILYIGRCRDSFKKRINQGYGTINPKNCYLDGQSTNCHINSLINVTGDLIELYVTFFESDQEIENNERMLIQLFKPKWNIALKN